MNINQDHNSATYIIQRYQPGEIWVNKQSYNKSIVIEPHQLHPNWSPQDFNELKAEHLTGLLTHSPEILILGTGEKCQFPKQQWLFPFYEKGIGVEVMSSLKAAHAFSALSAENRHVVAAILIR